MLRWLTPLPWIRLIASVAPLTPLELLIQQHQRSVSQSGNARKCSRSDCARCQVPGPFAPHDVRQRGLRLVIQQQVHCIFILLARWRCRKCRFVFTDHPTFVLPYKRYAIPGPLQFAQQYLDHDRQTYRKITRPGGMRIGYETPSSSQSIDERTLQHSTIWRMLSWLGCQIVALQTGRKLLDQHDPTSSAHRFVGAVAPQKYRSPQRANCLRTARSLLHLIDLWDRTFSEPFFPRFATRSGVP